MHVSYYPFVLYPVIRSVRIIAEGEFFSTCEGINLALPKQIYLLVWELEG